MDQGPQFIVEHQGRLYATISVVEYDDRAEGLTDAQKRGAATIRKLFDPAGEFVASAENGSVVLEAICTSPR